MIIRTADRERLRPADCPPGLPASSLGQFEIRADGTALFDRHHHDFGEFWLVADGAGTVLIGDTEYDVVAGDIIYTKAGQEHDILSVSSTLRIFWLSAPLPAGSTGAHLHARPEYADKHPVPVVAAESRS